MSLASKGGGEEVEEGESCDLQIRRTTKKKKKTERDDSEKISKLSFGIMFLLLSCSFSTFFFFFFFSLLPLLGLSSWVERTVWLQVSRMVLLRVESWGVKKDLSSHEKWVIMLDAPCCGKLLHTRILSG